MHLLIFRHGLAQSTGPDGTDASRPLSAAGIERTMLAAQGLATIAIPPQAILTSPKVRAVQTAALLADVFDVTPQPLEVLGREDVASIIRHLRSRSEDAVLIVGHEPTLSDVVERLIVRGRSGGFITFVEAGCAYVQAPLRGHEVAGITRLHWLATAQMLCGLAQTNGAIAESE
jgi:phosphohistidine phosphatase